MACSLNGNLNFPLSLAMNVTEKTYNDVELPTFLDVKWGERTTQPIFTHNQTYDGYGLLNEGGVDITSSATTLIYNRSIYILQYAQLNAPTHPSFQINPSTVEMTLTFTATENESTNDKVIIIVLPFYEDPDQQDDPMYLQKMLDINNQTSTGLYSCLPADSENFFAYYSSCIVDPQNTNKSLGNVIVFISLYGTRVHPDTILLLMSIYNENVTSWPAFYAPAILQGILPGSKLNSDNYTTQIGASMRAITNGSIVGGKISEMGIRSDTLDAYKCVPFDPDNDVKNGTIQVDMNTGKPLTETLDSRAKEQETPTKTTTWSLSPGKIERLLGNSLGLFLAISFGFIIFYLLIKLFRGNLSPDALSGNVIPGWLHASPLTVIIAFICAFIGFLVGSSLTSS